MFDDSGSCVGGGDVVVVGEDEVDDAAADVNDESSKELSWV